MFRSFLGIRARSFAFVVALGLAAAAPARVHAAPDARELKAREDFAAGRYEAALEIFARLYAETLHPNYLRNIGRCYQNLREPDRAITSFRDYLRKAKSISADEHAEIEGFIKEMEDLKRQQNGGSAAPVKASPEPASPPSAPPSAPPPPPVSPTTVNISLAAPPPEAARRDESPALYERWWFWAIVAGVVGAGVGVAAAAGVFTHTIEPSCPSGTRCNP
jgi:tetratricopeptide (TPR) repeat protein